MKWISIKDKLPKIGQIVDIRACYSPYEKLAKEILIESNKIGQNFIIGDPSKLKGWRVTDVKYLEYTEKNTKENYKYFKDENKDEDYIIERKQVTHWMKIKKPKENK